MSDYHGRRGEGGLYTVILRSLLFLLGTCSFVCHGTSTRRQRSAICGLRVKLPPVTSSLTT